MLHRVILVITGIVIIFFTGCREEGVYKYFSFDNRAYATLSKPASITFYKDSYYKRRGYRKISKLGVYQKTAVCYGKCQRYSYKRNIYQLMADEAAKKGGEIVQITMKAKAHKKKVKKKTDECIRWKNVIKEREVNYGQRSDGKAVIVTKRSREKKCLEYRTVYGYEYTRWTFGHLWRKKK